jgi:hypothetical protein
MNNDDLILSREREVAVFNGGAMLGLTMVLKEFAARDVVEMDNERKATMVSNLMVVLCGDAEVHPVVNTGSLYT